MDDVIRGIVQVGYEISDCNPERLTDMGEALRIWTEGDGAWSWDWIDALTARWQREFPNGVAVG